MKTLEQQARSMAAKSPFPADRERFLAVAESYRIRAQTIAADAGPREPSSIGHRSKSGGGDLA